MCICMRIKKPPSHHRSSDFDALSVPVSVFRFELAQLKTRFIEYGPEVLMCGGLVYGIYTSHKKGFAQLHKDHRD